MEVWKPVPVDFWGANYAVSDLGNIMRTSNYNATKIGKILKPRLSNKGYYTVMLWRDSKYKRVAIHRMVALAFVENPKNKPIVDHIDGVKTNNEATNLAWVTNSDNLKKHWSKNKQKPITDEHRRKLSEAHKKAWAEGKYDGRKVRKDSIHLKNILRNTSD